MVRIKRGIDTRKSHVPELYTMLTHTIMIRRIKKDVLRDLPKKIYSFVPLELDNVNEYNEAEKDFITYLKLEPRFRLDTKESNTLTSTSMEGLIKLAVKGKLRQSTEWIRNFLEVGSKLVVFTPHKFVIEALIKTFPKVSVKLDGSVIGVERQKVIDDFQTNPKVRLLVGDLQAADVGVTLTTTNNIAFFEFPLFPGPLAKAENLCKRTGQRDIVNVYYLFASGSIEERIVKLIDNRKKGVDSVLEDLETDTEPLLSELIKDYE